MLCFGDDRHLESQTCTSYSTEHFTETGISYFNQQAEIKRQTENETSSGETQKLNVRQVYDLGAYHFLTFFGAPSAACHDLK
jgi:hypothetical protein